MTKRAKAAGIGIKDRLHVVYRIIAAVFAGYLLASLMIALMAYAFPMPMKESMRLATLLGYVIYAFIIMWAFSVVSLAKVWRWLLIGIAIFGIAVLVVKKLSA